MDSHSVCQNSILLQLASLRDNSPKLITTEDLIKIEGNPHTFTHCRSTVTTLTSITQIWYNKTENSCDGMTGIHALSIDFNRATDFDSMDLGLLVRKLANMNVWNCFW